MEMPGLHLKKETAPFLTAIGMVGLLSLGDFGNILHLVSFKFIVKEEKRNI